MLYTILWLFALVLLVASGFELFLWRVLLLLDGPIVYNTDLRVTLVIVSILLSVIFLALFARIGGRSK